MGPKRKKSGKKKAQKKLIGNETPEQIVHRLRKTYERNCASTGFAICPSVRSALLEAEEKCNLLVTFVLEPIPVNAPDDPVVSLEPFLMAVRQERYTFIKALHIWDLPLMQTDAASIALLIEKGFYPLKTFEIMDCLLAPTAVQRLSVAFNPCESLTKIVLDYNEFGDEGCQFLCDGLTGNVSVVSLSLCYCDLKEKSGTCLGHLISTTAIGEVYLDGNDLGCEGAIELIKAVADHAEQEAFHREQERLRDEQEAFEAAERERESRYGRYSSPSPTEFRASASEAEKSDAMSLTSGKTKKKKKKGKKKKEPPPPPPIGPWITKLHLADNGIDIYSSGGNFAPLICMRIFRKLLTHSICFEELDIDDNLIGELGGREVMEALLDRKEADLPGVKVRTTHRLMADTFNNILKLGAGLKKKKKKKGKKKKK